MKLSKTFKLISILLVLLVLLVTLNFSYAQAQQSYAETLDEISSRLPSNWHGFDQLSKQVSGQSLNAIWGKQEGQKYRYFQVGIWRFESKEAIEETRHNYESGQMVLDSAENIADDVVPNAEKGAGTIGGINVYNLTSSSAQLQVDLITMTSGIYHDYGIFVWTFDAPKKSTEIWAEIAGYIGSKSEAPPSTPTPATEIIKSTSGSVGAFAYDWWWSKERKQDGRYGETVVTIDLPAQPVAEATLYVGSGYSQQSGSSRVTVCISTSQQVTPPDADHDRGSWWVGNAATLGQKVGDFETRYGTNSWSTDITAFVNQNSGQNEFYITFENHAHADVGIGPVYIEVVPSVPPPTPTPEPAPEPKPTEPEAGEPESLAPEPESKPAGPSAGLQKIASKIDKAEKKTLMTLLTEEDSFLNAAVESKITFGFVVGQLLERYDVDLELLKTLLYSDLYEKLDYAYDLEKIDSLRNYCRAGKFDEFAQRYREHAMQKVREEFSFGEAEERVKRGFQAMRTRVEKGELGGDTLEKLEAVLNHYILAMDDEMWDHAYAMYKSQEAAKSINESMGLIDKLTSLADRLFGSGLDKAKIASHLSLVWAQNQVRYWTTCAYIWGGTNKLKENKLEELRSQYSLFERQEFYYGTVFAAETGLEKLVRGEPIE